ncbi:MAG: DUF3047 domain-containing protein [Candidatus Omnitrophica bacterium]|nr:DUF3047 domain-containing protein [Candidatus Omnitrophota bacterium]
MKRLWLACLLLFAISIAAFLYYKFKIEPKMFLSDLGTLPTEGPFSAVVPFDFSETVFFKEWREHRMSGKTSYRIERDEHGEPFLHASSRDASSITFRPVDIKSSEQPFLSWEWKAIQFPTNKRNQVLAAKSDNDYAARVYVAFKGLTPFTSDTIQYAWDDHFPEGAHAASPYSSRIKILVIQHGPTDPGSNGWVFEKRDIVADYEMLYGKRPPSSLIAIGFMSDSDNTGTSSEAYFRRLTLERTKMEEPATGGRKNIGIQVIESAQWWLKRLRLTLGKIGL